MDTSSSQEPAQPARTAAPDYKVLQLLLILLVCAGVAFMISRQGALAARLAADSKALADLQSLMATLKSDQEAMSHQARDSAQTLSKALEGLSGREDIRKLETQLGGLEQKVVANTQAQAQALIQMDQAGVKRLENIAAQVTAKPQVQALRWAYLDQFALRDAAKRAVKPAQLKPEDNPETNPELAKKLAEYQGFQEKLGRMEMSSRFRGGFPETPAGNPAEKEGNPEEWRQRMAELKIPLAPYLNQLSGRQGDEKVVMDQAIRKATEGKYDLVIDRTFGDHQILFKTSQPVPDITQDVIQVLAAMAQEK